MYISTLFVRGLFAHVVQRGVAVGALLSGTGLTPADLTNIESHASLDALETLARNAIALTEDPALGLRIGTEAPANALQVLGHLVNACRTPRQAFETFLRHAPHVAQGAHWELREQGALAFIYYDRPNVSGELGRLAADGVIATMWRIGGTFTGGSPAHEVWFKHPRPSYEHEYAALFRAPVRFGQPRNALIVPRVLLDREQLHADDTMVQVLDEAASRLLHSAQPTTVAGRLSIMLRTQALSDVSLPDFARKLAVSERTLRARLAEEGVSFTRLVDDERCRRACLELSKRDACIKAAADCAGFSERTSFHRAFKRWTGQTPAEYMASSGVPAQSSREAWASTR